MEPTIKRFYGTLQVELERAKEDLKGVEESIKKIIGRDPNESPSIRPSLKRTVSVVEPTFNRTIPAELEFNNRVRHFNSSRKDAKIARIEEERPSIKRRLGDPKTVFSRLSGPPRPRKEERGGGDEDFGISKPAVPSQVTVTPREVPSRQQVLAAQGTDETSKARNRRMFGALLGTLQKFRQEETRLKDREEKRAQVEKKLEENAKREKEELKRERQELFQNRKRRQADIRNIELKMIRLQEQEVWEASQKHLLNFIQTKAKPHIFFLPKKHSPKTEELLQSSQKLINKMIEKKREEVKAEVAAILKRGHPEDEEHEMEVEAEEGGEDVTDKENQEVADNVNEEKLNTEDVEKSDKASTKEEPMRLIKVIIA
uniref:Pinin n=1 Tax=Homalodisca liturata TaxID=320908 RepID=A0A1B6IY81_9HEMI